MSESFDSTMPSIVPISTGLSPADTCAQAQRRLRESPYYYLKQVSCHIQAGVLMLSGQVPYPQLMTIAEAIVSRVPGVREVDNRIRVLDPSREPWLAPAARSAG